MVILLLLFPISFVTVVIAGAWHLARKGWASPAFQSCLLIFAYLALCYVTSFIAVCMHPYWEDSGAEELIPMKERWGWASLFAGFLQVILCPALWAMSWATSKKRRTPLRPEA